MAIAGAERLRPGGVTSKRKFPFLRQPKRLPRRAASEWCVYAAVVERDTGDDDREQPDSSDDSIEFIEEERVDRVEDTGAKRGRSVRFAGVAAEHSGAAEQVSSGDDKETNAGSTYTLSKFKFPEPPGHTWAGAFGERATSRHVTSN